MTSETSLASPSLDSLTALVLAGGRGTRTAEIYPDLPKPMVPVGGKPFLEWFVSRLVKQGVREILISTGYKADVIAAWISARAATRGEKLISCHEEQALGTGGAVAHNLPLVKTPYVMVMNGDTLFLADIKPAFEKLLRAKADGVIFARAVEDASRYGSLEVSNGKLMRFLEKKPGRGLINAGIYLFRTDYLRKNLSPGAASIEQDLLPRFLAEGADILVAETEAPFIDIGTPETLAHAGGFVLAHRGELG